MSLSTFASRMEIHARSVERNANLMVRRAAMSVDKAVVESTPVDTGKARSNWIASLDPSIPAVRPPYAPGRKLGLMERANALAAQAQAASVISRRKEGQDVYITNSVDYIRILNAGSSKQAPALFVQKAVQAGVNSVRGLKLLEVNRGN